jgi:hypothetical protein
MIQQTAPRCLHQGLLEGGDGASIVPHAVPATPPRDISPASGHSRIAGWRSVVGGWRSYKVRCNCSRRAVGALRSQALLRSRIDHIVSTMLPIISARIAIRVSSQSPRLDKMSDQRIVPTDAVHQHARSGKKPARSSIHAARCDRRTIARSVGADRRSYRHSPSLITSTDRLVQPARSSDRRVSCVRTYGTMSFASRSFRSTVQPHRIVGHLLGLGAQLLHLTPQLHRLDTTSHRLDATECWSDELA